MEAFVSRRLDSGGGDGTAGGIAVVATTATVAATAALLTLARWSLWPRRRAVIRGALPLSSSSSSSSTGAADAKTAANAKTADALGGDQSEGEGIPSYRPDFYPGARDVDTPYGRIHVYEFGPETGRKVLLLHGISTSCMTLKDIARPLAEKGCRVMLFDLFGRGYSDAPGDLPYDTRLFTTQILLALASSPLAWTGRAGFSLVGYSLGGGIAANFAAAFPDLVAQLVLLAPAGLIRPENIGRASRIVFQTGLVPDRVLAWLAERRLRAPIDNAVSKRRRLSSTSTPPAPLREKGARAEQQQEDYVDVAVQDAVDPQPPTTTHQQQQEEEEEGGAASGPTPYELRVASFVHWSLDHNAGFVPAMMSTMQHAPLMGQHNHWRLLARRPRGSTAVLLGRHDNLIQRADYEEDALPLLGGRDNVFWRVVPGAHNFPFTHGEQAMKVICEFMGL